LVDNAAVYETLRSAVINRARRHRY